MFFGDGRISAIRRMILADTVEERREALSALLPYQKSDFKGIYEVMEDRPVTIRLLDPPLHEFVPHTDSEIKSLADEYGLDPGKLKKKVADLSEFNPMLGHRGCRLAVTYPEIAEMQAEAIIMAAIELKKEKGMEIIPEIMIPLVGLETELSPGIGSMRTGGAPRNKRWRRPTRKRGNNDPHNRHRGLAAVRPDRPR